ncbi:nucleus protein [Moniliophthora roreri]|nr:nucleus protein [Moniliophthora roreri]
MGTYQQNLDDSDSHWALLGSAIKIAQNLGLSELGSESDSKSWGCSWNSLIKRETARRVWWNLIFNDWSNAAAHHGAYSIHPTQNRTALPANVNDVNLVDGLSLPEASATQYTEMSFSLIRFRFVGLYREIVDNKNRGYSFVLEIDSRLRDMVDAIPSYFENKPDTPSDKTDSNGVNTPMEHLFSLIMGENRRMRLHRPFLFKGYTDPTYAKSRDQCIKSARLILKHLKSTPENCAMFLKWWIVMFYGFAAAVVLFIDLCHHKTEDPAAVEARRIELQEALDLFRRSQHVSAVSHNAVALLERMMQTARPRSPRKRGSPENDEPFERVVKRMLLDSNHSSENPSQGIPTEKCLSQQLFAQTSESPESNKSHAMELTGAIRPPKLYHPAELSLLPWTEQSYTTTEMPATPNTSLNNVTGSMAWNPMGKDPVEQTALFREMGLFEPRAMKALENVTIGELGQLLWGDDSYTLDDVGTSNLTWAPVVTA